MKHRIVVYKPLPDDVLAALRARADVVLAEGADALARALPTPTARSARACGSRPSCLIAHRGCARGRRSRSASTTSTSPI